MHLSLGCHLSLYADDSALFFSHRDPSIIAEKLSTELSHCRDWLIENKLSLHMGKTECVLFGTSHRLSKVADFQISCSGTVINRVSTVKYLGVTLDQNLKFGEYLEGVIKQCAGRISFLFRQSALLDLNCRRILCNALIQPYLDYCCTAWYSSLSAVLRKRLDVIQRRMVRFIFSWEKVSHVDSGNLKSLAWLCIQDRVRFFKLAQVFKIRMGRAPSYLSSGFVEISQVHSHGTRGKSFDFHVSKEIAVSQSSFVFTAIKQWNELPQSLKGISSLATFKSKLKEYFMSSY